MVSAPPKPPLCPKCNRPLCKELDEDEGLCLVHGTVSLVHLEPLPRVKVNIEPRIREVA